MTHHLNAEIRDMIAALRGPWYRGDLTLPQVPNALIVPSTVVLICRSEREGYLAVHEILPMLLRLVGEPVSRYRSVFSWSNGSTLRLLPITSARERLCGLRPNHFVFYNT